ARRNRRRIVRRDVGRAAHRAAAGVDRPRSAARGVAHLLVLHRLALAHHFDLVSPIGGRIEAGAHLLALVDGGDARRDRLPAADDLRLRVHRQRHAAGALVQGDAVLVDLGHRAGYRAQVAGVGAAHAARGAIAGALTVGRARPALAADAA